jgi:pyruvate/2-oxoglutarate dehydrogenase complex dihydrolipoamide dehydrogenase (E3) component
MTQGTSGTGTSEPVTDVDVVVLGLGPGGEASANKLAKAGLTVIGVERDLVGGECPYYGCIPSKMMIRAANALEESRRVPELAGSSTTTSDWSVVAERIRTEATHDWNDAQSTKRLEDSGATVVRGHGRITGPRTVEVDGRTIRAARGIVLNTGTSPGAPPIDGLEGTPYWTNRDVFKIVELPKTLAVLGAGPIGSELAQVFVRFGVEVTLLDVADRVLSNEEPEASALLCTVLGREGVRVMAGVDICCTSHDDKGFHLKAGEETVVAEQLLVAAGRIPQIADVGLDAVGVDGGVPHLETDGRMRVTQDGKVVEGLWAVGDIVGKGAFTHTSIYQASVAVRDILGTEGPEADHRAVPRVTYTDPEVASVGLTEERAREQGRDVRTATADVAESSRGWLHHVGNEGLVKLVVEGDELLGATSVGPMGGEVLSMLTTAIHARVPISTLKSMIYPYPTFSGAVREALSRLG